MKIAVNCWVLRNKQLDGIGNFTIEVLKPLISAHPEIQFLILCDKNFTENYFEFPNVTLHPIFPALRHPLLYIFFLEVVLARFLKKYKPDLCLSMDGFLSLSSSIPQLPIIYDLNFEHYPADLPFRNRIYFRTFFKKFAKKATRIATISNYSKNDISSLYHVDPSKIDNVSCGVKDTFKPLGMLSKAAVKKTYSSGEEYFFFVGSMHPRKNIPRLLKAFDIYKNNTNAKTKLILAGHLFWDTGSIREELEKLVHKNDIIFVGRLGDEVLGMILGASLCLTYVPTFEGFGLPIAEAFQAGVPVICSNTSSMPEVAGDAAILVDPFDVNAIASAMEKINSDELLREELVYYGHSRKKLFSWEKTAGLLFESIMKALKM